MLAAITDKVLTGLAWIRGVHYNIADFFEDVADRAGKIPIVGGGLARVFNGIAGFFDHLGDEISDVAQHVSAISDTIDAWLDNLVDLWNDVHGWIEDKLDDAYTWAQNAIDQVAGVVDDVDDLLDEVFRDIPRRLSSLRRDIDEFIDEVFGSIPGKLSSLADKVTAIPDLIKGEVLQIIAPAFNLVSFFFEDIADFFSDPAEYLVKKVDKSGPSFTERLWDVIEKILERVW